jgi:hypothetical protein
MKMGLLHNLTPRIVGTALACLALLMGFSDVLLVPIAVRADVGVPSFMSFAFEYEIEPVPIIRGQMIECSDATCTTSEPFICGGFGSFGCESGKCVSKHIGPDCRMYHKLVITFADKTRESTVFAEQAYSPKYVVKYVVTVKEDSLFVREVFSPFDLRVVLGFCLALPLTLLTELIVAAIYFKVTRGPKSLLAWVFLVNIISLPVVWFLFPLLTLNSIVVTVLSELFAVTFEAFFLHITNRDKISLKHAGTLSLLMNVTSFFIGLLMMPRFFSG